MRFADVVGGKAGKVTVYDERTGAAIAESPMVLSDFLGENCLNLLSTYERQHSTEIAVSHLKLYVPPGTHKVALP